MAFVWAWSFILALLAACGKGTAAWALLVREGAGVAPRGTPQKGEGRIGGKERRKNEGGGRITCAPFSRRGRRLPGGADGASGSSSSTPHKGKRKKRRNTGKIRRNTGKIRGDAGERGCVQCTPDSEQVRRLPWGASGAGGCSSSTPQKEEKRTEEDGCIQCIPSMREKRSGPTIQGHNRGCR